MRRPVRLATVQPPAWVDSRSGRNIRTVGLELFDLAAAEHPDVICLPEYFNCVDASPEAYAERFGPVAQELLKILSRRASEARCYVVLPMVVEEGGRRFNRVHLLDRGGRLVGTFDKVHITEVERTEMGIEAGSAWPVFETDFGRVGVMVCYDGCFSESSRILALAGAKVIFWPSLQRSYTRNDLELQMRAHAYFNYSVIVRSSYGGPISEGVDAPGMVGLSGVCGDDGGMLASLDGCEGWTDAVVDVSRERYGARTFGGQFGSLRQMRFEDRRPDAYLKLVQPQGKKGNEHE